MSYSTACVAVEPYVSDECNDSFEEGKIGYVTIKDVEDIFDYSNIAEWLSRIAAGTIQRIAVIGGAKPAPEPVTIPGRGFAPSGIANQNQSLTYSDNNSVLNLEHYNSLRRVAGQKTILYETENYVWEVEAACSFQPLLEHTADGQVNYNVTVTWRSLTDPVAYPRPAGLPA